MVPAFGLLSVLLSVTGCTRYRDIEMMGIYYPADECCNELPAGSNIVHIIFFLLHNMMEANCQIVLYRLEDEPGCVFRVAGLYRFFRSRYNWPFAQSGRFHPGIRCPFSRPVESDRVLE